MNKFHSFTTSRTNVLTVYIFSPITNISASIIIQPRLTLKHFIFPAIAKMVSRTIVWVWVKSSFVVRTFNCSVNDCCLRSHKLRRMCEIAWQIYCCDFGCSWSGCANSFRWPHASFIWL